MQAIMRVFAQVMLLHNREVGYHENDVAAGIDHYHRKLVGFRQVRGKFQRICQKFTL